MCFWNVCYKSFFFRISKRFFVVICLIFFLYIFQLPMIFRIDVFFLLDLHDSFKRCRCTTTTYIRTSGNFFLSFFVFKVILLNEVSESIVQWACWKARDYGFPDLLKDQRRLTFPLCTTNPERAQLAAKSDVLLSIH